MRPDKGAWTDDRTELSGVIQAVRLTKAEVEAGLKRAGRLRQAILKRASEGKPMPQAPKDEPANVLLLLRIRGEREAAGAASGKRARGRKRAPE